MTFPEAAAYLARSANDAHVTVENRFLTLLKKPGTEFEEFVGGLSFERRDSLITAADRRLMRGDY